ncbi:heparan-alpha-glucosaminide N-acetyltransferase-like isoform X2 [Engystomops pustulosus]|uniref:heparan-alpha-glucosaminide N-acetyltransferase-like isoform X2 n=1 Tax=Engystomops pustulosus TaxID=76066 RepID=UPI003AFAB493
MVCGLLVLSLGLSTLRHVAAVKLKYDEALLTANNHLLQPISLLVVSDYCYKCLFQPLMTLQPAQSLQPTNRTVILRTQFKLTLHVVTEGGNGEPVCSWKQLYGEHGHYIISVQPNNGSVKCDNHVSKSPTNNLLPLLVAFVSLLCVWGLYYLTTYVYRRTCTQKLLKKVKKKADCEAEDEPDGSGSPGQTDLPKHRRLLSLDTFRGFSLTVMVFVNYGGGGYWFFQHAPWNGLTVADLVMPWFVFIIGTSVALAFSSMLKRGIHRSQLVRKLTWRTLVLMAIGVLFLNYGPADGPLSWRWARIPGVLQRLGVTYFVLALMHTFFSKPSLDLDESHQWIAAVRDIVVYWPEWIIIAALETVWLCLTFLLPVPGCPTGYLGPGGIGDDGLYPNCTGGAAGYIDKWLFGPNHIYNYPTCKELYKTTQPFDPEGALGTINSVVMAFFGLQAGKIILIYRKSPHQILCRLFIWSVLLGIISAILTKCTRDEGFIPINKNLWSLSFITTLSCFSFLLLALMFYVIDVRQWWGGQPFIYPGVAAALKSAGVCWSSPSYPGCRNEFNLGLCGTFTSGFVFPI